MNFRELVDKTDSYNIHSNQKSLVDCISTAITQNLNVSLIVKDLLNKILSMHIPYSSWEAPPAVHVYIAIVRYAGYRMTQLQLDLPEDIALLNLLTQSKSSFYRQISTTWNNISELTKDFDIGYVAQLGDII